MKNTQSLWLPMLTTALFVGSTATVRAESLCEGHSKMTAEKQHVLPINAAEGHMVMLLQDTGPMKSVGVLGDGRATDQGMNRLFHGNGEGQGYYTIETDEGVAVVKWQGTVNTVVKDSIPNTSFQGNWEVIKGSGKFLDMKGQGDYSGYFTSETTRVINWKGTCNLAAN